MTKPEPRIVIDFPDPLPIGAEELALIETYFSAEIASLLAEEEAMFSPCTGP